jgi:hypothetical protein
MEGHVAAPSVISRATTEHIAPAERIHYWEDYNRKALVGLSCTSYSEQGLLARQTNIELGELRLAEIAGNAHAIERSPQTIRSAPQGLGVRDSAAQGRGGVPARERLPRGHRGRSVRLRHTKAVSLRVLLLDAPDPGGRAA